MYFLDKSFFDLSNLVQQHFYCPCCHSYIDICPAGQCPECQQHFTKKALVANENYFLVMPLAKQLRSVMERGDVQEALAEQLACQRDHLGDIKDGSGYRDLGAWGRNVDNLTLTWSCDGAPVFASSNKSIWPLQCVINELPFDMRKKHILLHTLWFGQSKPRVDTYLKPFVDEINTLHDNGLTWLDKTGEEHVSKCAAIVAVCDAVARCILQRFKQFNGFFGCGFCEQEGSRIAKGRGTVQVYPQTEYIPNARTHASTVHYASVVATSDRDSEMGVKGASPLLLLPKFDIIKGFVPDYMHSVCLGVVKQFIELWVDSKNHDQPFYLKRQQFVHVDTRMEMMKPPSEITRSPHSLTERQFWKASEWRAFLLFYSPVILRNELPRPYYEHRLLLVHAMHLLIAPALTLNDISKAELCLVKFVTMTQELYGTEHVSYNVHLLTHLADSVRYWGPLWSCSAFIFEDACGKLLQLFFGTQAVQMQVFRYYFAKQKLSLYADERMELAPENARVLLGRMLSKKELTQKMHQISPGVHVVGSPKLQQLSIAERFTLKEYENRVQFGSPVSHFTRVIIRSKVYTTSAYCRNLNRDNSVVLLSNGNWGRIQSLVLVESVCLCAGSCQCDRLYVFYRQLIPEAQQLLSWDNFAECNTACDHVTVNTALQLSAVPAKMIQTKGVLINVANKLYVCKLTKM